MSVQTEDGLVREAPSEGHGLALSRSSALLAEAQRLIPGITQSLMKSPAMFAPGSFPVYLASGQGAVVRDVDGNEYIDYICGLGANTLGHNHPAVVDTIRERLGFGVLHSLPAEIEIDAARALIRLIPGAEMARFFKTGADATSAAVRLARHLTGKEKIVSAGYHGWHDHFMYDTPGVPAVLRTLSTRMPLFQEADEEPLLDLIAAQGDETAIMLLALPYNRIVSASFLHTLRDLCRQKNVMFVLDEVVTGFRVALGGAQQHYDLQADYVCLSKSIAAGMPLSAIVGPRARLARLGELQVSTTFGGELLSLAVCEAVLSVYAETDYIARIGRLGRRLKDGINQVAERGGHFLRVVGWDAIPLLFLSPDMTEQARLAQPFVGAMARRGVLLRRDVNFLSSAHTEQQVDTTIAAVADALDELTRGGWKRA